MHPTISYELAQSRIADLHRQARRQALARAAAHLPSTAPPTSRKRIPVGLRLRPADRGQATSPAA
ncbi:MAG TPA: hypothetical protein VED20_09475 [Streptosporangiaceae bacterium]|nr:hypothetical protein [Streptosporangiaceae bacterium]